jgi:hypothetical protein
MGQQHQADGNGPQPVKASDVSGVGGDAHAGMNLVYPLSKEGLRAGCSISKGPVVYVPDHRRNGPRVQTMLNHHHGNGRHRCWTFSIMLSAGPDPQAWLFSGLPVNAVPFIGL